MPAFPLTEQHCNEGMTLRDYFAAHAPAPREDDIRRQMDLDNNRNPYNEPHRPPLRSRAEIVAMLVYRHADAMLEARARTTGEG